MCGEEDDLLVAYHFGELDAAAAAEVERRLQEEPELAARLSELRDFLDADPDDEGVSTHITHWCGPPPGLADSTCEKIFTGACGVAEQASRRRFSLLEVGAVAIAALLLGSITMPALQAARDHQRRLACGDNLRELGLALKSYSNAHHQRFPEIGIGQNAGLFAVSLREGGYLNDELLHESLVCPSSELANQVAARRAAVVVPSRAELMLAPLLVRDRLEHLMAGSFAYRLGYFDERGLYVVAPDRGSSRHALMADAPTRDGDGALVSNNHGPCGQNVLYEDGHVEFQSCWSPCVSDHLYLNHDNEVAAGRGSGDIVLAPSEARPTAARVVRIHVGGGLGLPFGDMLKRTSIRVVGR